MQWIKKNWVIVAFVLVNLAIAAPADAGLKNSTCAGPGGEDEGCCRTCLIFCGCDFL